MAAISSFGATKVTTAVRHTERTTHTLTLCSDGRILERIKYRASRGCPAFSDPNKVVARIKRTSDEYELSRIFRKYARGRGFDVAPIVGEKF